MTTMINPPRGPLSEGLPSADQALFEQTVAPKLVRRVVSDDVFVNDLRVLGHNKFEVGIRLPAAHIFYGPATTRVHDPLLFLESVREAILLIANVAFAIPPEYKYITHEKEYSVSVDGLRTDGNRPVDLVGIGTAVDIRRRGRGFAGMRTEFTCYRDGVRIGTAAYRWSCVSAAGYARLRGERKSAAPASREGVAVVAPELVGRRSEIDVMLAETPRGLELCIDPAHPVVFDHPIDHVPGNGAVEVARQAALLAIGKPHAVPTRCEFSFEHYIEFDSPCLVRPTVERVRPDGTSVVRVLFEQGGNTAASSTLELAA